MIQHLTLESLSDKTPDRELLRRFLGGDESAFTEIVQRHAGLVMGVCRRVLREAADAEDAFQATFLVLARKAGSLDWQNSVAAWLHVTARRTALKLRGSAVRRRDVERKAVEQKAAEGRSTDEATSATNDPSALATVYELSEILDDELAKLPAKFRDVFLLSQFEGLSREEVADRLGITSASVKDRLERGREQLRLRLVKRGVTLTAVALAAWIVPGTTQAAGSSALIMGTAQAAGAFATGNIAATALPAAVTLAQGVLKMMGLEKLKIAVAFFVSLLTVGSITYGMLKDEPTRFENGLRGQIVSIAASKPFTVTIALEEFNTLLNLDISESAKLWTAFEAGKLTDLKAGQFVSLRLGEDHRTVNEIHVQGAIREASIQSVASTGKIVIVEDTDDDDSQKKPIEVELAADAILRIGGLPASRDDLKPGMQIPLEFGIDGKRVNAIEAEAFENTLVEAELQEVNLSEKSLMFKTEEDDDRPAMKPSFLNTSDAIITLDGKSSTLAELKVGASLRLRLSNDGKSIRAIQAKSPEPDDDTPMAQEDDAADNDNDNDNDNDDDEKEKEKDLPTVDDPIQENDN